MATITDCTKIFLKTTMVVIRDGRFLTKILAELKKMTINDFCLKVPVEVQNIIILNNMINTQKI